jgi:hypothetical protein
VTCTPLSDCSCVAQCVTQYSTELLDVHVLPSLPNAAVLLQVDVSMGKFPSTRLGCRVCRLVQKKDNRTIVPSVQLSRSC